MCAPSLGQVWVLRVPLGFGPRLAGCVRHFRPPPLLWSVFGPLSVRFFFSLALSGFARSGLGVLVLVGVFPFFPFLFYVPRLVSRLSSLSSHFHRHLISTSLYLHLHLICRSLKSLAAVGRVCETPQ